MYELNSITVNVSIPIIFFRLLSSIHSRFQSMLNESETRILLTIFFKTFKAYGDIIDNWLTEGRLDDWKNEFFIQRFF